MKGERELRKAVADEVLCPTWDDEQGICIAEKCLCLKEARDRLRSQETSPTVDGEGE